MPTFRTISSNESLVSVGLHKMSVCVLKTKQNHRFQKLRFCSELRSKRTTETHEKQYRLEMDTKLNSIIERHRIPML